MNRIIGTKSIIHHLWNGIPMHFGRQIAIIETVLFGFGSLANSNGKNGMPTEKRILRPMN